MEKSTKTEVAKEKHKEMKVIRFFNFLTFFIFAFMVVGRGGFVFAQDSESVANLTKAIFESKSKSEIFNYFEKLSDIYFSQNNFAECVKLMNSISAKKKELLAYTNYFSALSRYYQLKHWEETQNWDDYFASGNALRQEIVDYAQKAMSVSAVSEPTFIYSRLLLWRFHNDQQDALCDSALTDLLQAIDTYSETAGDIKVIKEVADQLFIAGQKGKSKQLYRLYVEKLLKSTTGNEQLWDIADSFYGEGNLDLAQEVFDAYISKLESAGSKEKLTAALVEIAQRFSFKDRQPFDFTYAEKVFAKTEEIAPEALTEDLLYLRGYNLEKGKDFLAAAQIYEKLLSRFPNTRFQDELKFKLGIIFTYVGRNRQKGEAFFKELAEKQETPLTAQLISSIYQLGILSQWQGDSDSARKYYQTLLERAGENFSDTTDLAKKRLKEIEESRPIEYNLKTFLDVTFNEEYLPLNGGSIDLKITPYQASQKQEVGIGAQVFTGETGCMPVELQYLWSGHLGTFSPSTEENNFNTSFIFSGTKEINLVVVSPSGVVDSIIDIIDIK